MKLAATKHIVVAGRRVDYRLVSSRSARKRRIRIGISGVEVIIPTAMQPARARSFLASNGGWVLSQIDRIERLRSMRRPRTNRTTILFRGEVTPVSVEVRPTYKGSNRVLERNGSIIVIQGEGSAVPAVRSLENWLRRQAKLEIVEQLRKLVTRLRREPNKVFVMGQRTKWGNCSGMRNLSFNWRLIMAPPFVLRYLVTHEAAHLAVPDHSHRFWLTVQSLCPTTERAKQWLVANADQLLVDLRSVLQSDA